MKVELTAADLRALRRGGRVIMVFNEESNHPLTLELERNHLEFATDLATEAHIGQKDKCGEPYILHPLRVAAMMGTETEKIVAVLHDVIEDTLVTRLELVEYFIPEIVNAVMAISREKDELYFDYINRCKQNPIARKVKIADLKDNMSPSRVGCLPLEEQGIVKRYEKAMKILTEENQ